VRGAARTTARSVVIRAVAPEREIADGSPTRVRLPWMSRSRTLAVAAACLMVCARLAAADAIDANVRQLAVGSDRVRLAAAAALAQSPDPRAVTALAAALVRDSEVSIRKVSALALETIVDARTPPKARDLALDALDQAAKSDPDPRVRQSAARAVKALAKLRPKTPRGPVPPVFVNVDATVDHSKRLPGDAGARLTQMLKESVERTGYATSWPGGLPTSAELASTQSRAFIVAGTVMKLDITKVGARTQIACTVAVRVAPWTGKDGGERWEANRAASASGSATATAGSRDRDVQRALRDCVETVAESVTSRQVLPFLKQVASARP